MTKELSLADTDAKRFEQMNQVVELWVRNVNPTKIAKELGIRRVDVLEHIDTWKKTAVGSDRMRNRVEELLATTDEHYSDLIREARKNLDEINGQLEPGHQMLAQRTATIKVIADLEATRIDIMQKAGLLDMNEMGDQMAEIEDKQRKLMAILQEVSAQCPNCKNEVARRISQITGKAQPLDDDIVVEGDIE